MPVLRLIGILFVVFGAFVIADGIYNSDLYKIAGGLGGITSGFVLQAIDKIVTDIAAIRAKVEGSTSPS